ncbi:wax synthase-like protein [Arabidopsis thaliana]|uniref:Probable long-chain-alcohol O-fatty-acyltransferase 7 n=2 Tax=Arabidopsis thaliana TaxID=3702 RepID=WAXS7_ARATH|nr:MBOAT (membrane bound O-acyl transferase) family protein [Arabidopsis thaliana]Q9FJ78.1 RecName: Full=Probable long-chain-alcohol O-fatty-acyltransferase 7; AltName: Full=Wax synthase 7 [Arabidopsis thaliana]AED96616.1 MBOAT (membrane bound O-acyl transferase) family protein [Arabidopsis thaliana]BAB08549.1 wax synthase-like protein [Arabidopsis thaliana]|eukprot:NP_200343.1 MBOAT (membrane bound O-acyl transferase) family protein [Arabidopsis thaliana]
MEEEIKSLINVGFLTIISVSYCYCLPPRIKSGVLRLLSIFPVCVLLVVLPLFFSFSIFTSTTAFFLSAIANSRLILFSFDQGPLFPLPSNLFRFTCFTCFPIQRQQNPKSQDHLSTYVFPVKIAIFVVLLYVHNDIQNLPRTFLLCLHPLYVYLLLEILLTLLRILMTIILGCDLEPHFHEPYLATSLQDFWGRRWNLIVSASLRAIVYTPVRRVCQRVMSSDYAMLIGVFATFVTSGVAHEVVFFYITRAMPTGEVALFFLLHGVCTVAEVAAKRTAFVRRWPVRPVVSWMFTIAFVNVTAGWLFFPQLIRNNLGERCSNEISLLIDFFRSKLFYFPQ